MVNVLTLNALTAATSILLSEEPKLSAAEITPIEFLFPIFPVIFDDATGLTIFLVYINLVGVEKNSMPSKKNGRFSGK